MPSWPGCLGWLDGWLGWLGWLAGLAWLDGMNAEILHARRSEEVGGFGSFSFIGRRFSLTLDPKRLPDIQEHVFFQEDAHLPGSIGWS